MADIGLPGSGPASHALQVGDCIIPLKGFWDAVKDAPEEIKHLIEEIETLSLVLSDFENGENPGIDLGKPIKKEFPRSVPSELSIFVQSLNPSLYHEIYFRTKTFGLILSFESDARNVTNKTVECLLDIPIWATCDEELDILCISVQAV
jgi:hypothetical protein